MRSFQVRSWDGLPIEKTECFRITAEKRYSQSSEALLLSDCAHHIGFFVASYLICRVYTMPRLEKFDVTHEDLRLVPNDDPDRYVALFDLVLVLKRAPSAD